MTRLLGVLIWPAVLFFFMFSFRKGLGDFFGNLGEFSLKAPWFEAAAKRQQVEAAVALGAAVAARPLEGGLSEEAADLREVAEALPSARDLRRLQGKVILWVDDRPDNNIFERQALEALGILIRLSESTEEAIIQVMRRSFDLIISDMGRPPDMRAGYTLLNKLREAGDRTPFLIYSGSRAPEHIAEASRRGASGSTNSPQELIGMVNKILLQPR